MSQTPDMEKQLLNKEMTRLTTHYGYHEITGISVPKLIRLLTQKASILPLEVPSENVIRQEIEHPQEFSFYSIIRRAPYNVFPHPGINTVQLGTDCNIDTLAQTSLKIHVTTLKNDRVFIGFADYPRRAFAEDVLATIKQDDDPNARLDQMISELETKERDTMDAIFEQSDIEKSSHNRKKKNKLRYKVYENDDR